MKLSIRKFLLINLLLAITLTSILAAIGNYYLDQQDIEEHLDTMLAQSTLTFEALISDDLRKRDLNDIQDALNQIPDEAEKFFEEMREDEPDYTYEDKYQFQVYDDAGKLLLHSANSPNEPLAPGKHGFSFKNIGNVPWRIFSTYNPSLKATIVVAERYDIRNELAHKITLDDVYIMMLTYILAGFLIWIIIGRGLASIKRVADEVGYRAPTYLEPVNLEAVPEEIVPLVDELNRLFLRLQLAFEREKRFAGDAAHELRTPLAALKTQAQVASKATTEEERQAVLQNLITGVDRCAYVVQQLLTLSQLVPESNTYYETSELNLPKVTAETIAQLVPYALEKQIDIELESDKENLMIHGNATAISILIRNLVDNAIRYTPEQGSIHVVIKESSDHVILRVTDTGPGIPPELRARVFERFFRVLGTKATGSGLGLSIVQQIAKLHNAEVKLGSPSNNIGLEIEIQFPKENIITE